MNHSTEIEVKVGIFVAIGLILSMISLLMLGGSGSLFSSGAKYYLKLQQADGLVEGAIVKIGGVKVGQISNIQLSKQDSQVEIELSVDKEFATAIKEDSFASIQTQGVLGDRFVVISSGTKTAPVLKEKSLLRAEPPKDLKDYLSTADQVLVRLKDSLTSLDQILGNFNRDNRSEIFFRNLTMLSSNMNETTKGLKDSINHLNSIMGKVDKGNGTLGAIINDPTLYNDMKSLLGGANRNKVLKYFIKKSVEDSREAAKNAEERD